MENLKINATKKTPQIEFDYSAGELSFSGRSIPENAVKLYEGVLQWVKDYAEQPMRLTNFRLNVDYFNTSSMMWIARMIKVLSSMKETDYTLMIHLYYDIHDLETMDADDVADAISPVIDLTGTPTINVGVKIYGIDDDGKILKETMVLI